MLNTNMNISMLIHNIKYSEYRTFVQKRSSKYRV